MFEFLADLGPEGARVSKVLFPMFCIIEGYFPVIVELDGNRKSTYSLHGLDCGIMCLRWSGVHVH